MKKILVDCHKFDEDYQGITTYIEGLYKELITHKEIDFYFAAKNIILLKEVFGDATNIHYKRLYFSNKWFRLLLDFPRIIIKNKIDYAHFQYVVPPIKLCKYITTIHDVLFLDYPQFFNQKYIIKNRFLFNLSSKLSDVILTVSNYSKDRLIAKLNVKKPIYITPNAVNAVYFQKYNKEEIKSLINQKYSLSRPYFILVSRIEPRKNHLLLLKTFIDYEYYKKYDLVFVGKKDLKYSELHSYFNQLESNIKNRIHFLENVNNSDLLNLIQGATLSVYPSLAEGFGIPPLETLAANIPTVCSNTTAMKDFHFLKEYQFCPTSCLSLKEKIDLALEKNGMDDYIEQMKFTYNWKISAKNYLEAIQFKNSN